MDGLTGLLFFNLPIEEVLLFFTIPFASVFVYELIKAYFSKYSSVRVSYYFSLLFTVLFYSGLCVLRKHLYVFCNVGCRSTKLDRLFWVYSKMVSLLCNLLPISSTFFIACKWLDCSFRKNNGVV